MGILAAKVVIIENSDILAFEILPYRSLPKQAGVEAMERALDKAGLADKRIDYCLSTGFGKRAVPYADDIAPDVMCLHRAVRELNPSVRTVVDVGGHSFTAFNIDDDGRITESAITDKCAAGTGKFIEVMAKALEMPVDELGQVSPVSSSPLRITSQCVILAESDVISYVNEGYEPFDIFAGIASSVANKIAGLVRRISVNEEVAMVGGVAKNSIVVSYFEKELGLKLADLAGVDSQIVGAFGAALMAEEAKSAS